MAENETPPAPPAEAVAPVAAPVAEAPQIPPAIEAKETNVPAEPKKEVAVTENPIPASGENLFDPTRLGLLNDVSIALTIEVGKAQIKLRDLLNLSRGSVIELNKSAGDPVDVYANGKLISTGNIITANGKYCVRLTSISEHGKAEVTPDGK